MSDSPGGRKRPALLRHYLFWFHHTSPSRLLVSGFATVILAGAVLLWLPIAHNPGHAVSFLDALFVSTSAVCVTGLTTIPCGETLSIFGRTVLGLLIQIGGLGVASAALLIPLFVGGKISLRSRQLLVEASNLSGYASVVRYLKIFLAITFGVELVGAVASFFVFRQDYPFWSAVGFGLFHSVSSFNNAGFDVLGGYDSLLAYAGNVPMNLITTLLVIVGGLGFLVLIDLWVHRRQGWRALDLNTKVVVMMTTGLLVGGTVLLKLTTSETWLESWFQSVIARTAGFNTFPIGNFSMAGVLVFIVLMFIGASPGSTGGGIKTTTAFAVACKAISSTMHENRDSIFHRRIPSLVFEKALTVFFFGLAVCGIGTFLILCFEPDLAMYEVLVEVVSAFATVGSTVGITPGLCAWSKLVLICCMFIGRLGPVTIATLLVIKGPKNIHYTEESIMIG